MYLEPSPSDIDRLGAYSVVSQTEIEKSVQNCDKKILCGIFITFFHSVISYKRDDGHFNRSTTHSDYNSKERTFLIKHLPYAVSFQIVSSSKEIRSNEMSIS